MTQATAAAQEKIIADSPLRYLMCADDRERKKWGERAVALGFPLEELRTGSHFAHLLPWIPLVSQEMHDKGLWKEPPPEPEKQTAKIIQLPLWPEPVRGIPNDILRSAIFAAIQGKNRRFLKDEVIASVDGIIIKFRGEQLDQSDLDVWEQAVHLARSQPVGNVCNFTAYSFLKGIGRGRGKSQYQWLDESISRLIACAVIIKKEHKLFKGSLLSSCKKNEKTGVYELRLDPDTIKLYSSKNWSSIEWKQRQALIGKPLALWLHGFYSSHAAPFHFKVETLRELCGSENKILRSFREKLRQALNDVKACGVIADWQIDPEGDLVIVGRGESITESQRRYLAKNNAGLIPYF